ncbi:MAG TPA: DUF3617 domain-containing protein [Allosphingosinicella sp.]|jgi:hypothetical protein|nr:DUF3617 domain-containing protein [Allosphingosinicella sp.]
MRRPFAWAAAFLFALAACGSGDEETGGNVATDRNAVAADLARVEVRPGLWEVSSEVLSARQPGMPVEIAERMKGPRGAARHCITPAQAARPDAAFLAGRRSGQCSYSDFAMRGGRIGGQMACRAFDGAETRARMSGTYTPEAFDMRMDMETPGFGNATLAVVVRQSGRRIGECPG